MNRIKLYCIPYAGGSANIYRTWKKKLPESVDLCPVELAGRGNRFTEPYYNSLEDIVDDIYTKIKNEISEYKYAFFGHSMGSLVAYELTNKIIRNGLNQPMHIFFSGRGAPCVPINKSKIYHTLSDDEFIANIAGLGGTTPDFFSHPELVQMFIPLLKNDFKISETDVSQKEVIPFDFNISVLVGTVDDITSTDIDSWKKHSSKQCDIHYIEGGHFFISENEKEVVKVINNVLNNVYSKNFIVPEI